MACLLDLSDELFLLILAYLQEEEATEKKSQIHFYNQARRTRQSLAEAASSRVTGDLRSLMLSCRRFGNLLKPIFYRDVAVPSLRSRKLLKRTLEEDESLEQYIVSADVPCSDSIYDVYPFFWLHNIHTLTLTGFRNWEALEWEDDLHVGTSPVQVLRLFDCGAHEAPLAEVLSWPQKLEELHYDANQGEWAGHYEGQPEIEWTCAAFVRALQPQKGSLKTLTMTRPWLDHEGLFMGPRIDLSDFKALTTLRIFHVFFCGWDDPNEAWRTLPRNLEVLELYYDDVDCTRFTDGENTFLVNLIRNKKEHLPKLRRVAVESPEVLLDPDTQEAAPAGPWIPQSVAREFERAEVKLTVRIGWLPSDNPS